MKSSKEAGFTHLEFQVLRLFAEYYSERETAEKLKLDLETVRHIKTNVMKEYNLKSCLDLRNFLKTSQ